MIGARLSHYEVLSAIGKGGMGEVWRARDTKLGREVAIKTLPDAFARDSDRLARFEREARLLASLNHPNIAAIYGLEEHDHRRFLVLELVEGDTLADRIRRGPIPVDESLWLAFQIAEALEAAHEKGVVHRDLKPANIKVTADGTVKVLDFGLAKALETAPIDAGAPDSPTISMAATREGIILGTAAYMSPEQASGREADKRTDIWAFGAVLFEMLTGQGVFSGETASEILADVLKTEPAWNRLPTATPAPVRRLLKRCLVKDRKHRLHDIADARLEIDDARTTPPEDRTAPPTPARPFAIAGAGVAGIVLAVIGLSILQPAAPELSVRRLRLPMPGPASSYDLPVLSPDGEKVAYTRDGRLWIQHLARPDPVEIPDSYGAWRPFWSPGSDRVGYYALGRLRRAPVDGGPSTDLAPVPGVFDGAAWGNDGTILFAQIGIGLTQVSAEGDPEPFMPVSPDRPRIYEPEHLPGGEALLFAVGHLDGTHEIVVDSPSGRQSFDPGFQPFVVTYSPTGHLLYDQRYENGVWAVPFSIATMRFTGEPFLVTGDGRYPSVSVDGTLVYQRVDEAEQLAWVTRDGAIEGAIGSVQDEIWAPALSPDGRQVAVQGRQTGSVEVWIYDVARGGRFPVTSHAAADDEPAWSPRGDRLAFSSNRFDGTFDILIKDLEGRGEERPLVTGPGNAHAPNWSSDGTAIAYHAFDPATGNRDLWVIEPGESAGPRILLQTPFDETLPQISPNGDWVAYQSNRSGAWEIFAARFPSGEDAQQISIDGGLHPRWSRTGDEIYYLKENTLMAVPIRSAPALDPGSEEPLFDAREIGLTVVLASGPDYPRYNVRDNGRFIAVQTVRNMGETESNIIMVENWFEAVSR